MTLEVVYARAGPAKVETMKIGVRGRRDERATEGKKARSRREVIYADFMEYKPFVRSRY